MDAQAALAAVGGGQLTVVSKLSENWHGDGHWLVRDHEGNRFSLRAVTFGREIRWEETRRHDLSVLTAQLDAADDFIGLMLPVLNGRERLARRNAVVGQLPQFIGRADQSRRVSLKHTEEITLVGQQALKPSEHEEPL